MARIRTVKPELFRHEDLYEAEIESGLPLRLAFIGLFTCCDREGRFEWRPRQLKLDVMPYDTTDFSHVLDALERIGLVEKYLADGREIGCIPTFLKHQCPNAREAKSKLPPKENNAHASTCINDAGQNPEEVSVSESQGVSVNGDSEVQAPESTCMHMHAHGERELEGEREGNTQQLQQHANVFSENVQPYQQQPEMSDDWNPDETTVRRIAMTSVPEDFIRNCVPEFRAYWLTAGRLPHGGNFQTAFLKSVQKAWAKHLNDTNQRGNGHAGSQLSSREAELRKANESTDWADGIGSGFPGAHTSGHSADQLALDSGRSDISEVARVIPSSGRH